MNISEAIAFLRKEISLAVALIGTEERKYKKHKADRFKEGGFKCEKNYREVF